MVNKEQPGENYFVVIPGDSFGPTGYGTPNDRDLDEIEKLLRQYFSRTGFGMGDQAGTPQSIGKGYADIFRPGPSKQLSAPESYRPENGIESSLEMTPGGIKYSIAIGADVANAGEYFGAAMDQMGSMLDYFSNNGTLEKMLGANYNGNAGKKAGTSYADRAKSAGSGGKSGYSGKGK